MDKQQTLYYEFIPTGEAKMKIDPAKNSTFSRRYAKSIY